MDIILPGLTEDEILARVAHRGALLQKASKMEVADHNQQFQEHVNSYLERPSIVAMLANADRGGVGAETRSLLANLSKDTFVYTPSVEKQAEVQAVRTEAYGVLSQTIHSQKWSPDTSKSELHIIMDLSDPQNITQQTFLAIPGPEHKGLSTEKLHDAVHKENHLKNRFATAFKEIAGADAEYKWSFDAARNLVVDISKLSQGIRVLMMAKVLDPKFEGLVKTGG